MSTTELLAQIDPSLTPAQARRERDLIALNYFGEALSVLPGGGRDDVPRLAQRWGWQTDLTMEEFAAKWLAERAAAVASARAERAALMGRA